MRKIIVFNLQQFTNLGLIDEYRLIVNPLILGNGKPLFKDIKNKVNLRLIYTRVFKNGNVLLCYQPLGNEGKEIMRKDAGVDVGDTVHITLQ